MKEEIKRDYYDNGQLCYEVPHVNGNWYGLYKRSHYNGQLWCKIQFKNNFQQGARIEFEY